MTEATPADANTQPNYPFQFDARLAWVRECKQQFLLFVLDLASQTPKHKRQWFSFAEIVSACANMANLELDLTKQERALQRLREAVLQGDFVDARGRSTIANLHPSAHSSARFSRAIASPIDPTVAADDLFRKYVDSSYLWMSRADCEAWFRRYEIAFPKEWMLNSNRPDLMHGSETPGKIPRYPLLERPTQPAPAYAYYVLLNRWGLEGPPRSLSIRQITGDANEHRLSLPENKDYRATPGGISESTVRRALGLNK